METRKQFIQGKAQAESSVTVATTKGRAGKTGLTVSAMCSVTADDPVLLICVNQVSSASDTIARNGRFCVHLLRDDQANISDIFVGHGGDDRFAAATWTRLETRAPVLDDHLVTFDCKLVKEDTWGTHRIFIGEVVATSLKEGDALLHVNRQYARPTDLVAAA